MGEPLEARDVILTKGLKQSLDIGPNIGIQHAFKLKSPHSANTFIAFIASSSTKNETAIPDRYYNQSWV